MPSRAETIQLHNPCRLERVSERNPSYERSRGGTTFGFYGRRNGDCDGIQIGLTAGVFSQFNLDTFSLNLINADYLVGFPITVRRGHFSGRLRVYHQSSHLGDEFLLENQEVDRVNLSFEALDLLLSYDRSWWRVYGGGGYLFSRQGVVDPLLVQGGIEFDSDPIWRAQLTDRTDVRAVSGVDAKSFQERDWGLTVSAKGGLEAKSGPPSVRRFRLLFVFLKGFIPFGQFFSEETLTNYGVELQYEF